METRQFNFEYEPNFPELTIQQETLARGMMNKDPNATIEYSEDDEARYMEGIDQDQLPILALKFKHDPKTCLAYGRSNIFAIKKDVELSDRGKEQRVKRYLDAFLDLQIKIDKLAYPPDDVLQQFVPEYIPDQLTDMGSNPKLDARARSREKIRVDKEEIFNIARPLLEEIFTEDTEHMDSQEWKLAVVKKVADFVYEKMPYNHGLSPELQLSDRSVILSDVIERRLAVCRHQALVTQVLLQALGLTSRLLKCDVEFMNSKNSGAHAANLVRIDYQWYLLDVTNPEGEQGQKNMFLKPVSDKNINLNTDRYTWMLTENNGSQRKYTSRDNMFFKITKE